MLTVGHGCTIVDLSHPIHTDMPVYPLIARTFLGIYKSHQQTLRPGGISSQTNILMMCDHAGTHIDSPVHFNPHGEAVDKMPLGLMIGQAVMQDYAFKRCGEVVSQVEVEAGFRKRGIDPRGVSFVLFRTGGAELYGTDAYLSYFLEIHRDTVLWLIEQGILVFGVDAITVDDAKKATHMLMREKAHYHMENMANLDKLPQDRPFTLICVPLPLKDASASPVRPLALLPQQGPA